jgi:hypothetical protein
MTAAVGQIGHARALDLGAATPAFQLTHADAAELRAHLAGCADCARRVARMRADLDQVGALDPAVSPRLHDRIREIAVTQPRTGPSPLGVLLVLSLLAIGVVGASIGVGAFLSRPITAPKTEPTLPADAANLVDWRTDVVELTATSLVIDANGKRFFGAARPRLSSDPGDPRHWTLEATWPEQGVEQRLTFVFAGDGAAWWIDDVQAYDGAKDAKWVDLMPDPTAPTPKTPLGTTFQGDLDLKGAGETGDVRVHLGGLRIAVHPQDNVAEPITGVRKVLVENADPAVNGNPFLPGGPLHCSGILQLPPLAAEARLQVEGYALSWRWDTATGPNQGYAEPRAQAPSTGWITDTQVGSSGELIVFVANPANPFGGPPRDLPEDCAQR